MNGKRLTSLLAGVGLTLLSPKVSQSLEVSTDTNLAVNEQGVERIISRHYFKGAGFDIGIQETEDADAKLHVKYARDLDGDEEKTPDFGVFYLGQGQMVDLGTWFNIPGTPVTADLEVVVKPGQEPALFAMGMLRDDNVSADASWYGGGQFDMVDVSAWAAGHTKEDGTYVALGTTPSRDHALAMFRTDNYGLFGLANWDENGNHYGKLVVVDQPGGLFTTACANAVIGEQVDGKWDKAHKIRGGKGVEQLTLQVSGSKTSRNVLAELGRKFKDWFYVGAGVTADVEDGQETQYGLAGSLSGSTSLGPLDVTGEITYDGLHNNAGLYGKLGLRF